MKTEEKLEEKLCTGIVPGREAKIIREQVRLSAREERRGQEKPGETEWQGREKVMLASTDIELHKQVQVTNTRYRGLLINSTR